MFAHDRAAGRAEIDLAAKLFRRNATACRLDIDIELRRHRYLKSNLKTLSAATLPFDLYGREDLAEAAVGRQLDIEAQIPILERTITDAGEREKELEGCLAALQGRRREMSTALEDLRRRSVEQPSNPVAPAGVGASRGEKASRAFDRILERATQVPGARDALENGAQLAELESLVRRNRIRERLAEARARLDG